MRIEVFAPDGGDDAVNGRVGPGGVEVVGPRLRVAPDPLGIGPHMGHLDHLEAEALAEFAHAHVITVGDAAWPAPRRGDSGHPAAGCEDARFVQVQHR